jgi:hypothetical protein
MRLGRRPPNVKTSRPGNSNVNFDARFALRRKMGAIRTAFESSFQSDQFACSRALSIGLIQSATCIEPGNAAALRPASLYANARTGASPQAGSWMACLARSRESPAYLYSLGL